MDYYRILGITRGEGIDGIQRAYRTLAIKFNPETNKDNLVYATEKFKQIAEAYEVLSNKKLRASFDQFGEQALKKGLVPAAMSVPPFVPSKPEDVYEQFFGTSNPYSIPLVPPSEAFIAAATPQAPQPPTPISIPLEVSLEELFSGCLKKVTFMKQYLDENGKVEKSEEKILHVMVKRGFLPGTQLSFKGEGDQQVGKPNGNAIVTIYDLPHPIFKREGSSLKYTAHITLEQALIGCTVELKTLDGRLLRIPINDIVCPGYTKTVPKEGIPDFSTGASSGDLIIEFDVQFPKKLSDTQKNLITLSIGPQPEEKKRGSKAGSNDSTSEYQSTGYGESSSYYSGSTSYVTSQGDGSTTYTSSTNNK
eukprot:TRINITY_DN2576_c0_g1_i1.p1 TRINITY_DN2576_c0_g1~~TRINITY_DN2576_c0_g1_i1.p1  ORF type:complete len:373 (-),score=109.97 TRINITY_DN2576_c0_g1_i1:55-1146(-)